METIILSLHKSVQKRIVGRLFMVSCPVESRLPAWIMSAGKQLLVFGPVDDSEIFYDRITL